MGEKRQRIFDLFLAAIGIGYLVLWYYKLETNDSTIANRLEITMIGLNVFFAIEYCWRLIRARARIQFLRSNILELFAIALPFFRVFRAFRAILAFMKVAKISTSPRITTNLFLGLALPLLTIGSALAILDVEGQLNGAKIATFPDAIWWAFATITTVGYGDLYPITVEGRVIAGVLVMFGLGLLSVVTANVAAWFIETERNYKEN